MSDQTWLYLKVFFKFEPTLSVSVFEDGVRNYLDGVVKPFFADAQQRIDGAPYFFIRYHDNGFHLRVRVLCPDLACKAQLDDALRTASAHWQAAQAEGAAVQLDRIEADTYQPEYSKYGGVALMPDIEQHFMDSSALALDILEVSQRGGVKAEYVALWLIHETVMTLGFSAEEVVTVLNGYARFWRDQLAPFQPDLGARLLARYQANKAQLSAVFAAPGTSAPFEARDPALGDIRRRWIASLQRIIRKARDNEAAGLLTSDFTDHVQGQQDKYASLSQIRVAPFTSLVILPNLLHMLNNRIGVDVNKEAQLSFTICHYLMDQTGATDAGFDMVLEPTAPAGPAQPSHAFA
ncbi:thiopeptide-type bacteriocin biosynthesis protein [Aestuariibacter halophilus]|uniref:Thiopeptide-type bacteriocin biosynthesis protein n=1 Tax=Fluctibacter halophilus TaxID=226011 RepID=A0ABS8G6B7_9ALTE|nr:thiopeptide-type bacteriocin biosynthesis protein [Aestuariibacter halophilus]MCC2616139.1 thiopeptide-type bacteriocin biosynthesis protein [Aestuariibacter halophilus]